MDKKTLTEELLFGLLKENEMLRARVSDIEEYCGMLQTNQQAILALIINMCELQANLPDVIREVIEESEEETNGRQ